MRAVVLLSLVAAASAFDVDVRKLRPEDAGLLHTDAFEKLAEMYTDREPRSRTDIMMDISKVMEGYCDEDDSVCKNMAYESTLKSFHADIPTMDEINYPEYFHSGLKTSFNKIGDTLKELTHDNLDDVVDTIQEITNEMRDMEDVDANQRTIALSSASIALESTKLWHNVFHSEEDNNLRRRLQGLTDITGFTDANILGPFEIVWKIVGADAAAAMNNGINLMESVGTDNSDALFAVGPIILISVVYFAIPASLNASVMLGFMALAKLVPGSP